MRFLFLLTVAVLIQWPSLAQLSLGELSRPRIQINDPYATPTLYVKWDATGAGTGASWTDAKTTIAAAISAASNGSVIAVSGGASGHTYAESFGNFPKYYTLYGSTETGHDGPVTVSGTLTISITSPSVTNSGIYRNLTFTSAAAGSASISGNANVIWTFKDCNFAHNHLTTQSVGSGLRGRMDFIRCRFYDNYYTPTYTSQSTWSFISTIATNNFMDCIFDVGSGVFSWSVAGSIINFKNCTFLAPSTESTSSSPIVIGNSSTISMTLTNCAFLGQRPISQSGANSTNVSFSHNYYSTTSVGSLSTITATNCLAAQSAPLSQTPTNGFGRFIIRVDDQDNAVNAWTSAQTLNPDAVVNFACDTHSVIHQLDSTKLGYIRNLIDNGNDVGSHGGTHSDQSDRRALNISATGTGPTVSISGTRSGDSDTWTGTMTVTINGTPLALDLAASNKLSSVISYWNGRAVGDGTVSCSLFSAGATPNSSAKSLCLADLVATSISANTVLSFNAAAFTTVEVSEAIADLQAYVRTGSDRNGNNNVTGAADPGSKSESYTVKWFAAPFGLSSSETFQAVIAAGLIGGNMVDPNGSAFTDVWKYGAFSVNPLKFPYDQVATGQDVYEDAVVSTYGPQWTFPLWHGLTVYDNGVDSSVANLKTLCNQLQVGMHTFSDSLGWLQTNADYTVSNSTNVTFTGTASDYLWKADLRAAQWSALRRSGTSTDVVTDFNLWKFESSPDIGALSR